MKAGVARYAVIGNPVAHSRSPLIHQWFATQTGEALTYETLPAPLDGFADSVTKFFAAGGSGMNVTVPFKLEAHALVDVLEPRALAAGAVNTLWQSAGRLHGDNTDGIGLVRDIEQGLGVSLAGLSVLLLGAGGAARGAMLPLIDGRVAAIDVLNRTAARAEELVASFDAAATAAGCRLSALDSNAEPASLSVRQRNANANANANASSGAYDIVINATAGSLSNALPAFPVDAVDARTLAYDMMYGAQPTVFLAHCAARGARCADGLGMLVEQAAEAFFIWRGVRPETAPVQARLRAQLIAEAPPQD
ncbi:MAG: shikimate dehydrogenase [Janthinobacterium lividum]